MYTNYVKRVKLEQSILSFARRNDKIGNKSFNKIILNDMVSLVHQGVVVTVNDASDVAKVAYKAYKVLNS